MRKARAKYRKLEPLTKKERALIRPPKPKSLTRSQLARLKDVTKEHRDYLNNVMSEDLTMDEHLAQGRPVYDRLKALELAGKGKGKRVRVPEEVKHGVLFRSMDYSGEEWSSLRESKRARKKRLKEASLKEDDY